MSQIPAVGLTVKKPQAVMNIIGPKATQGKNLTYHCTIKVGVRYFDCRSILSDSVGHEADESSEGEDVLEAKTPVAQVFSYSPEKSLSKSSSSPPSVRHVSVPPPSKESSAAIESKGLNLAAPFGDPLTKWTSSKQNLLLFGPSNFDKTKGTFEHEVDAQSVSTVSGSGMDFFRKFVQRKGPTLSAKEPPNEKDCKACENQFRREVLIDRLVADALNNQQGTTNSSSNGSRSSESSAESAKFIGTKQEQASDLVARALESSCSSGKCPVHQGGSHLSDDLKSVKSFISESTVSGTGLLFLRNYLKKKTAPSNDTTLVPDDQLNSEATMLCDSQQLVFNTVPIPFPPKNDFYGPAMYIPDDVAFDYEGSRRNSIGSTIADLLNDNFDSEDSELKNLDWDDWEEEQQSYQEFENKQSGTDTDDSSSIVVDILDMARPVLSDSRVPSSIPAGTECSFETDTTSEPTYEELKSINVGIEKKKSGKKNKFSIPFLDLPSPPSTPSSGSVTPTADNESTRSILSTPHQDISSVMSDCTISSLDSGTSTGARRKRIIVKVNDEEPKQTDQSKKRLAEFWERRVSGNFEQTKPSFPSSTGNPITSVSSVDSISKFKPAIPTYYDPEGNRKANEKIQRFLEATRKAADDSGISVWSSNYDKLKRGELSFQFED